MFEWFKLLFHHHKWEIKEQGKLTSNGKAVGKWYMQQCSVCGKLKHTEFWP